MKDKFDNIIYNESDIFDILLSQDIDNINTPAMPFLVDNILSNDENFIEYKEPSGSISDFDKMNQENWFMPEYYKELNIIEYVLDLCDGNSAELQRCGEELLLFAEYELLDLLRYMVYLVDIMEMHNIIWGVGRGSSVSSFVLYKLKVHQINSLYYDLDIKEFLHT